MRRKTEAWAVRRPELGLKIIALKEDALEWLGENEGTIQRLVPHDPTVDEVMRHIRAWRRECRHWKRSDWEDSLGTEMVDAIEAYEAARKRKAKR